MAPGGHPPQNTVGILDALPSDVRTKVKQLAQMLQQNINEGKITEAQIQRELMSGNLQQTIESMNPEAGHLLDDISTSMKNSPNVDNLPDLLGSLTEAHTVTPPHQVTEYPRRRIKELQGFKQALY